MSTKKEKWTESRRLQREGLKEHRSHLVHLDGCSMIVLVRWKCRCDAFKVCRGSLPGWGGTGHRLGNASRKIHKQDNGEKQRQQPISKTPVKKKKQEEEEEAVKLE